MFKMHISFSKIELGLCLSLVFVLLFVQSVCAEGSRAEKPTPSHESDPLELTFATVPSEMAALPTAKYIPLLNHIAEKTGKKVSFYMTTAYSSVLESMIGGFVDIAELNPVTYVIGKKRDPNIEAFAALYTASGIVQKAGVGYHGCLITKKGSGFTSIDSLKGRTLVLTDPASTSGCLVPKVLFTKDKLGGQSLESYFGEIIWAGAHDSAQLAVKEGKVDAAFTNDSSIERMIGAGHEKKEDFNFLWWSDVIPRNPWVFRKNLNLELREKIKEAFLTFKPGEVEGADKFMESYKSMKFYEVDDSVYDPTRMLVEAKEKTKQ